MDTATSLIPKLVKISVFILRALRLVDASSWWARISQVEVASFGNIWAVFLPCRGALLCTRLDPGGCGQDTSVRMWMLYIQTALGKLCLCAFVKADVSFRSGCVTTPSQCWTRWSVWWQAKIRMSTDIHTGTSWFAFSARSTGKCFKLKMQCLERSVASRLLSALAVMNGLPQNPRGRGGDGQDWTEWQSAGTCPSSRLLPQSLSSPGGKDTEGKSVSGKAVEISLTSVMHIYEFGLRVSQLENW